MRVDFYLLEQQSAHGIYPFVARLCEKLYQQQQALFILLETANDAHTLNEFLWTFNEASFIPHCLADSAQAEQTLITLHAELEQKPSATQTVLNLAHATPASQHIQRVLEVVPDEENWRRLCRQKFADYRQQNHTIQTHKIQP